MTLGDAIKATDTTMWSDGQIAAQFRDLLNVGHLFGDRDLFIFQFKQKLQADGWSLRKINGLLSWSMNRSNWAN